MKEVKYVPESFRTAMLTPIILSEKPRVQMSFEGKQVDNYNDLKKNKQIHMKLWFTLKKKKMLKSS